MKLLGCFQGLSDDFSAQFVTRPGRPPSERTANELLTASLAEQLAS